MCDGVGSNSRVWIESVYDPAKIFQVAMSISRDTIDDQEVEEKWGDELDNHGSDTWLFIKNVAGIEYLARWGHAHAITSRTTWGDRYLSANSSLVMPRMPKVIASRKNEPLMQRRKPKRKVEDTAINVSESKCYLDSQQLSYTRLDPRQYNGLTAFNGPTTTSSARGQRVVFCGLESTSLPHGRDVTITC